MGHMNKTRYLFGALLLSSCSLRQARGSDVFHVLSGRPEGAMFFISSPDFTKISDGIFSYSLASVPATDFKIRPCSREIYKILDRDGKMVYNGVDQDHDLCITEDIRVDKPSQPFVRTVRGIEDYPGGKYFIEMPIVYNGKVILARGEFVNPEQ